MQLDSILSKSFNIDKESIYISLNNKLLKNDVQGNDLIGNYNLSFSLNY